MNNRTRQQLFGLYLAMELTRRRLVEFTPMYCYTSDGGFVTTLRWPSGWRWEN